MATETELWASVAVLVILAFGFIKDLLIVACAIKYLGKKGGSRK